MPLAARSVRAPSRTQRSSLTPRCAFVAALVVPCPLVAANAHADPPPGALRLCVPDAPIVPGCVLAPPGIPPSVTPQERDAFRARVEAEQRARRVADATRAAEAAVTERRREQWLARAEAARPADVPVKVPTLEAAVGFRLAHDFARKSYVQVGPEIAATYRLDRTFAIELPIALMQTSSDLGRWATIGLSPALSINAIEKPAIFSLRAGPDVLIPSGASGAAPTAMIGGEVGVGVSLLFAALGDGGFAAFDLQGRVALRGGIGGSASALDAPRSGLDVFAGMRIAY